MNISDNILRFSPDQSPRVNKLPLRDLDEIPYVNEQGTIIDHKNMERGEQLIAERHIHENDSVLELGGRYGTVSAIINNKLNDPYKHIVIEPEEAVIPSLLENRKTHNSYFTVYQNIICNKPKNLVCAGYATRAIDPTDTTPYSVSSIPSMTLQSLIEYHGHSFNVVVADCEGCLEEFVTDNMDFIKQLRLITYEKDFPELSNYEHIACILRDMGFTCVEDGSHPVWSK